MGKLFLPKETHGLWDPKSQSLTIYVGDYAYVGYQGTAAEMDDLRFSAWSSSLGECATEVYDEGSGKRSTLISTKKPGTLTFECTDGEKSLAPPIMIYIRMRPDYRQSSPEGQNDETACWAACLAWWLLVQADRPTVEQSEFLNKLGVGLWNKSDGTINPAQLEMLVAKNGYRMRCQKVQPAQLVDFMGNWPMIIGFKAPGGFGHMNVLCGYDANQGTVDCMEPMYPDPASDSDYDVMDGGAGVPLFYSKTTGEPYVYTGTIRRGVSFDTFRSSPMKGGFLWIGYPAEYAVKM